MDPPFRSYSGYLRQRYGGPAYRVAVDGGFSCPNRGPDRDAPGCTYCDESGSRAPYLSPYAPCTESTDLARRKASLTSQIRGAEGFLRERYGPGLRTLYFQAFSGTYAEPEVLRELYDHALSQGDFRELIVSTRPDCVDDAVADLLAAYRRPGRTVWVELGLQSAHDRTLERVRRGHTVEQFRAALRVLRSRGLKIAVHLIFGLPGEGLREILETVGCVASLGPDGLKIHNLHVPRGCALAAEALSGELSVPCDRRHLLYTLRALELTPPDTVLMRLTCDTPARRLLMPRRFMPKTRFYEQLRELMKRRNTWQGRLFGPGSPAGPPDCAPLDP